MGTGLELQKLERRIVQCRRCPRLVEWREQVARDKVRRFKTEKYWGRPVPAFGDWDAELIIIGLAPAAHGANRTGRLFTGDRSGDWLYEALHRFGLANQAVSTGRDDGMALQNCFITAVLRCPPPGNKPTAAEVANCRDYLRRELTLVRHKRVVVALGGIAFSTFARTWIEAGGEMPDPKPKFCHAGEWILPGGICLIASYHPSRQNTQTGKLTRPMFHRVFRRVRDILS